MNEALLRRVVAIHSVPPRVLLLTALASYAAQMLAIVQGWPLWAIVLATLLPWIPIFTLEMAWTYYHYKWLALFYVLVVTQGGHFMEHVAQMFQIHFLGFRPAAAHGVFGALDIEWVHFIANSWVLLAVAALVSRYRANPWLWVTLVFALWHQAEHTYIMAVFLPTGQAGTPGLLALGGAIGGGLPLIRPDLHFIYNLIETAPLFIAFAWQLRHTYDEWLARALPHLSEQQLAETTNLVQPMRFDAGETLVRQGDPADRFYIIAQGEVRVTIRDEAGAEAPIRTMGPGQFFGEIGLLLEQPRTATVRANTPVVEVLAMDRDTFRKLVQSSIATAAELEGVARQRLSVSAPSGQAAVARHPTEVESTPSLSMRE